MRRALPVLLLLALLLQQLVWPLLPSQTTRTAEMLAHVSIHLDAIGHHHHSDSALHLDERSDDADVHTHHDASAQSQPAILIPLATSPRLPASTAGPAYLRPFEPDPAPGGLLRPPRSLG